MAKFIASASLVFGVLSVPVFLVHGASDTQLAMAMLGAAVSAGILAVEF